MTPFAFPAPAPLARRLALLESRRAYWQALLARADRYGERAAAYRQLIAEVDDRIAQARQALAKEEGR